MKYELGWKFVGGITFTMLANYLLILPTSAIASYIICKRSYHHRKHRVKKYAAEVLMLDIEPEISNLNNIDEIRTKIMEINNSQQ